MAVTDTRPYELAVLRGLFNPDSAREAVRSGSSKLFGHNDTKAVWMAFLKLHFGRDQVTRESLLLEMKAAAYIPDEHMEPLLDSILDLPEPVGMIRLIDGLGTLRGRAMLAELTEYLGTRDALQDRMAGAVAKVNEFTASMHSVSSKRPETLLECMYRMMERTEPAKTWLPGLGRLDNYWKIRKGSYTVIGADSGSGKTSMLIHILLQIARQGTHVGLISIEMTSDEVTFRAAAMDAGVDADRIEDNLINDMERELISHTIVKNSVIYERIHVIDDASVTAEQLHGKYNELITRYNCEVVAIDYIQRVGMSGKNNGKVDIVTNTSETITAITKATGVATIALSVLNEDSSSFNGAGQGGQKRKGLNNLKNARQIGHDASTVVILTMMDGPNDQSKYIVVESVKNRKGGWFLKPLLFEGAIQRFSDDGSEVNFQ